jgi:hypothetical protein
MVIVAFGIRVLAVQQRQGSNRGLALFFFQSLPRGNKSVIPALVGVTAVPLKVGPYRFWSRGSKECLEIDNRCPVRV